MNYRHQGLHFSQVLVIEVSLVPPRSLDVKAVHINTELRPFDNLRLFHFFEDLKGEGDRINLLLLLSRVCLKGSSHESMREEEPREPEALRMSLLQPIPHKLNSQDQVIKPG
jgi:hypothetical protein